METSSSAKRWNFIGEMPRNHAEKDYLFVHGSPRNPINEPVFPEDTYNHRKMEKLFALIERCCFVGHTHIPGILTEEPGILLLEELDNHYKLGSEKVLINVGSVGLPGDGDERASYVVLDGDTVYFHRVKYDAKRTIEKIRHIEELDNRIADRLQDGTYDLDGSDIGVGIYHWA
jgi:diadenosine tetraphosphatase ApaH/serine/threonine PP2A family protein phosphatase